MKEIKDLFTDPNRVKKLVKTLESAKGAILADYTKTHIEDTDIKAWKEQLETIRIKEKVNSMFAGERINYTEDRQVLHVKLRSSSVIEVLQKGTEGNLDKEETQIVNELKKMKKICDDFENENMMGASGKKIRSVVGIGIGGSDLGPRLLTSAIPPAVANKNKQFRYVSNVDSQEMHSALSDVILEETVFIIVSKTFTTQETLENTKIALSTLLGTYSKSFNEKDIIKAHFLAVTAAKSKAVEFGIEESNILDMWDYVGGRYSIWSCVSLTSAMSMGFSAFLDLLSGGAYMDTHFINSPITENIPMVHAMVECKYFNGFGYNNKCIVPYDYYMKLFSSYLQQCEMESNGKSFTKSGNSLISPSFAQQGVIPAQQTAPVIWGTLGTDAQHSYFQLLHQGTVNTLTEFLIPANPRMHTKRKNTEYVEDKGYSTAHDVLLSNCLAQSRALMMGKDSTDGNRYFGGNRPSITLMYDRLTPYTLGMLLAMYEHKIFIQGQIWDINSYDQFGVELGKVLAKEILKKVEQNDSMPGFDQSTDNLLCHYQQKKE